MVNMKTVDIIKNILAHPTLSNQKISFSRFLILNKNVPQSLKKLAAKLIRHLPRKVLITSIKYNQNLTGKLELDLDSYIGREIFYGAYEPALSKFYINLLKTKKVVWEIGANIGYYTVLQGLILRESGNVFAFEPVPVNFSALKKNITLNQLSNVKLFNVALSAEDGVLPIYMLDTAKSSSSPSLNKDWANKSKLVKNILINTKNPFNLLENGTIEHPDLIKIDAETHEHIILETLKPILIKEDAPDIICEIMPPTIMPLENLLIRECSYKCYHITPNQIYEVSELKMKRPYNDYFFTKANGLIVS